MCSYVVAIDENPRGVYRDAGRASTILGYIPTFFTGCSHSRGTRRRMEGRHLARINNSVRRARVQRLLFGASPACRVDMICVDDAFYRQECELGPTA